MIHSIHPLYHCNIQHYDIILSRTSLIQHIQVFKLAYKKVTLQLELTLSLDSQRMKMS